MAPSPDAVTAPASRPSRGPGRGRRLPQRAARGLRLRRQRAGAVQRVDPRRLGPGVVLRERPLGPRRRGRDELLPAPARADLQRRPPRRGGRPWAYRLVNILLHALASVLVLRLLRDLLADRPPGEQPHVAAAALAGALLFAVHPVHVEAVAWISGIMDVACTAFALLAFDLYRHADATPRGRLRLALGLVSFLLAMLAKEPAALLPVLLVLHDLLCRASRWSGLRGALARWLPWFAVLGLYLGLRTAALGGLAPHGRPDLPGLAGSLLIAADLFARYVRAMFVPVGLSLGHFAAPPDGWGSLRGLVAIALLLATAALAWQGWKRHRVILFGLAVFALTLAPALYLPGLRPLLSKLFSERFLYFPSVGWAIVVASALGLAASRTGRAARLVWLAAALVALVFAGMTVRQNLVWRSELTLWADAVAKYPADGMNHLHYGTALIAAGRAGGGPPGARPGPDRRPGDRGLPRPSRGRRTSPRGGRRTRSSSSSARSRSIPPRSTPCWVRQRRTRPRGGTGWRRAATRASPPPGRGRATPRGRPSCGPVPRRWARADPAIPLSSPAPASPGRAPFRPASAGSRPRRSGPRASTTGRASAGTPAGRWRRPGR